MDGRGRPLSPLEVHLLQEVQNLRGEIQDLNGHIVVEDRRLAGMRDRATRFIVHAWASLVERLLEYVGIGWLTR